jgi:hypothetical protein
MRCRRYHCGWKGLLQPSFWTRHFCCLFIWFEFCSTGVWTLGLHLEHSTSHFFVKGFFKIGSRGTICPGWLWTVILLISASWAAKIKAWAISTQLPFLNCPPNLTHSTTFLPQFLLSPQCFWHTHMAPAHLLPLLLSLSQPRSRATHLPTAPSKTHVTRRRNRVH